MRSTVNNWNSNVNKYSISLSDMIKKLLEQPYKLVLVQQHELERLRHIKNKMQHSSYIERLYEHYIIKELPKTYLHNEDT